ncbi:MAG: hypothetical protein WCJ32_15180 [Actinomycetota bacterium]
MPATKFDEVGAPGLVFLRLSWAAVILCAFSRPRLPLGLVDTLQLLGPLGLAGPQEELGLHHQRAAI